MAKFNVRNIRLIKKYSYFNYRVYNKVVVKFHFAAQPAFFPDVTSLFVGTHKIYQARGVFSLCLSDGTRYSRVLTVKDMAQSLSEKGEKGTVYTKLADLKADTIANVYGVVKFFKSPFKSKRSDFVCTLSLTDPSFDSMENGFKLVLFSKSREMLPQVKSIGDIIRFHHIAVGEFKGELQGKLLPQSSW